MRSEDAPQDPRAPARRGCGTSARTTLWVATALVMGAAAPAVPTSPRVVDLHVDLPYALHVRHRPAGDADAGTSPARLVRGGVEWLVLPLFVPDAWDLDPAQVRAAYEATYRTLLQSLEGGALGTVVRPPGASAAPSQVATILALEGADGFADNPVLVAPWIRRGVCLVGLVHFRTNALAGSSTDPDLKRRGVGLTESGELLVRTVYSHGGLIDMAHASDTAMDDIARIASDFGAPLVDSHTGMRALRPIERNISDAHLRAIASSGGVVGIDLHAGHIGRGSIATATLRDLVEHIEHAVAVAGSAHVALGSDLEGGITQPKDADGAATWGKLAALLRERGWQEPQLEAVFRGNATRVLGWARRRGCGCEASGPAAGSP